MSGRCVQGVQGGVYVPWVYHRNANQARNFLEKRIRKDIMFVIGVPRAVGLALGGVRGVCMRLPHMYSSRLPLRAKLRP